jgi:hypothetical protein
MTTGTCVPHPFFVSFGLFISSRFVSSQFSLVSFPKWSNVFRARVPTVLENLENLELSWNFKLVMEIMELSGILVSILEKKIIRSRYWLFI